MSQGDLTRLDDFNERVGHQVVTESTKAWNEWMRQRGAEFKPGTAARYRTIFQAAVTHGCKANGIRPPTLPRIKEPTSEGVIYLPLKQQYRLLASYNHAARQVAITLCYQGFRTGEALALEWRHVNFEMRTLFVATSKSGHSRTVPMHPVVERRLRRIWAKRGQPTQGRVFLSSRGLPYRIPDEDAGDTQGGNPLTRAHITARGKAGISFPFRIHDWRHHWASHMVMSGCDLFTLMRLGGWRTPRMVQRYAAISTDHMAEAVRRMK